MCAGMKKRFLRINRWKNGKNSIDILHKRKMVFLYMETIFLCSMLKIAMKISFIKNTIDENRKSYYDGFNDKK